LVSRGAGSAKVFGKSRVLSPGVDADSSASGQIRKKKVGGVDAGSDGQTWNNLGFISHTDTTDAIIAGHADDRAHHGPVRVIRADKTLPHRAAYAVVDQVGQQIRNQRGMSQVHTVIIDGDHHAFAGVTVPS